MSIVSEKVDQAVAILGELDIDCWLTFVRETTETGDPVLPLILGQPLTWQSALILTKTGERIAIVGKYEDDAVRSAGREPSGHGPSVWTSVLPYVQSIRSPLVTTLKRLNPRSIALNYSVDDVKADGLSHGMMLLLREYLGQPLADRFTSASDIVRALRSRKTPGEVQRVRSAIQIADDIFERTAAFARIGITERAISDFMHNQCDESNVMTAWERAQCPIVTTGPESIVGHGTPSDSLSIQPGRILHLDFGVRAADYCSDVQRVWYVPLPAETAPPPAVQRGFDAVVRAIQAGFDALRPGVQGWEVDAAARKSIIESGYPEYQHATGHGVGRAAHDGGCVLGPRWERYGRTPMYPVEPGNVFTLELGIDNLDGRGSLGLEEMVLVTEGGPQWLTTPQTQLPMLGTSGRA